MTRDDYNPKNETLTTFLLNFLYRRPFLLFIGYDEKRLRHGCVDSVWKGKDGSDNKNKRHERRHVRRNGLPLIINKFGE